MVLSSFSPWFPLGYFFTLNQIIQNTICFLVVFDEFQNLLTKQAPIEGYTEWLDTIIDTCVLQVRMGVCDYREMYVI